MTEKEQILRAIQDLPADAGFEEALDRLVFLYKIQKGLEQADAGQTVTHDDVRRRALEWLK